MKILAIHEVRWINNGKLQKRDYTLYYSGDKDRHEFGTGSLSVLDFQPNSNRVCRLRIRSHTANVGLNYVHAPHEKRMIRKNRLYEHFERMCDSCPMGYGGTGKMENSLQYMKIITFTTFTGYKS